MHYFRSTLYILALAIPQLVSGITTAYRPLDTGYAIKNNALRVYLDCYRCDRNYIRTEITFVNFVRDRKEAQVHILVTSQPTASRGQEYTLAFIGQQDFAGKDDTLKYISRQEDTNDIIREGLVRILKLGLVGYAAKTPLVDYLDLSFTREVSPTALDDRWDSWVFRLSGNTNLSGEERRSSIGFYGSVSANRITEALKIRLSLSGNYDERNFGLNGDTKKSITRNQSFSGLVAKSITDHWSAGAWLTGNSTTYRNIKRGLTLSPAVEYNIFPYSQSTRRELSFVYRIGASDFVYVDTTIYDQIAETLFNQSLDINLEITEPWGTLRVGLEASHYFHDLDLNRLELSGNLNLRLFKGLSLNINGGVERIHDQLALAKGDATPDEIYLRTRELATSYEYQGRIGLSYTFGSIYSNVVNPRFAN